jgi:hypothetical protein
LLADGPGGTPLASSFFADLIWESFPFGLALILLIETSSQYLADKFATNRLDCLEA